MNSSFITLRPGKSAQTRQSLSCSHMKSMDVDKDSDLIFELYPSWIRQHGLLRGGGVCAYIYMISSKIPLC